MKEVEKFGKSNRKLDKQLVLKFLQVGCILNVTNQLEM